MEDQELGNRKLIAALIGLFFFGGPIPAILGYKFASKGWGSAFLGWILGAVVTTLIVLIGYGACFAGLTRLGTGS